jgi:exosortase
MNPKLWNTRIAPRNAYFVLLVLGSVVIFWRSLVAVFGTALYTDQYSHVLLIMPVSVAVLYREHSKVFRKVKYSLPAGLFPLLLLMTLVWVVRHPLSLSSNDTLSLRMALFVSWIILAFVFCFGAMAFRAAAFPLLFLLLMVPIPDFALERIIWLLQACSTEATFLMLKAVNIPVLRTGFVLSLPAIDIEVAKECSGIRSTLIMLIVTIVLGHLFLRPGWRQILLGLMVLPITVVKNGLRIFTLSILGTYVDPSFLTGNLHRDGGILFFAVALAVVISFVWWLRKSEKKMPARDQHYPGSNVIRPL